MMDFVRSKASAEWRTTFCGWFAYNFDYVICCGFKELEKLRASFGGKCLFYLEGGICNSKCKRWILFLISLLLIYGFLDNHRYRFFCFWDFFFPEK